ncbi:alpha/beta fold hydrolase [Mycolicibacter terrae]|uniref:Alpha/beta hydrolase n=2 Tax=Mycolicibacter TaxID=1073531 RepID=A0A1A2NUE7_MYCSD|nr:MULTISPECIES: alpha/beta fold hydrolase [Mycolicibacter]OBH18702.1 alpha/beta hydrolase [Mycolicibacter sinensis]OBI27214.1 alpha/beta hydrolase [Mycolicibacter sinensis]RRR42686.1 alpha/beta fold hydrolase [Mycolicibacter terrae]
MTTLTASDGVTLAVHTYTDVDPQRPTILAIHGYPDNHHVWDGVAEALADTGRYNVVAYDVRGAGASAAPADRSGYRLPQLTADVGAVIAHLGVEQVHLLGHDWGSIQGWAAVTDPCVASKIASYTSISGPHLDYAGRFLRSPRNLRAVVDVIRQLLESSYIWLFLTPRLPEALFRSGFGGKLIDTLERIGRSGGQRWATHRGENDYVNGLNLYRANMPRPFLKPSAPLPVTEVAVQVLAPRLDLFVSPALQRFTGSIPRRHRVLDIDGGHWVVTDRPEMIARHTADWVERAVADNAGAPESRQS